MRLRGISSCREGDIIGKSIMDDTGRALIMEGAVLSERLISKLKDYGINIIYLKDDDTEDIFVEDSLPIELRQEAMSKITTTFKDIQTSGSKVESILARNADDFKTIIKSVFDNLSTNKKALNMMTMMQANDHYVFQHSFNVMIYSTQLMINMKEPRHKVEELGLGAILHDIGKLQIPQEVLHKPGKLTNEEFDIIKEHTNIGFEILRKIYEIPLVSAHCAFQHHERVDGTGYPRGLKGNEIHPYAKVLGVADVFDAVTSNRVYRKAMLPSDGMELLYSGADTHFESSIVDIFKRCVALYPEGLEVTLNTGEKGVVKTYDPNFPGRPVVKVLEDPEGGKISNGGIERDMRKDLTLAITDCSDIL